MKFLAVIAIVLSASAVGFNAAMRLQSRAKELLLLKNFILRISEEIRYTGAEKNKIVSKLLNIPEYLFIKEKAFTDFDDKQEVEEFLSGLGKSDVIGQLKYCERFSEKIKEKYIGALKSYHEKGRIYCVLGVSSGLAISLIII